MPRKPSPPKPTNRELSLDEQQAAIGRLEARIEELRALVVSNLQSGDDPAVQDLEQRIKSTLASIYGEDSRQYVRLKQAASLDLTSYVLNVGFGHDFGGGTTVSDIRDGVDRGRKRAISTLQGEVDALKESFQFLPPPATSQVAAAVVTAELSNEVFVVHGHDDAFKREVADVLRRAGLNPVILHEQPSGGKTIIEKFEKHGSGAGFAVVLLTPDDVGGPSPEQLRPRTRQNVIGEMFWFAGKLGRSRVCALRKGDVEVPTDFAGVIYTTVDDRGAWKTDLLKELSAAGYPDLNWGSALS
jgi:predicted nucleotide-binding protein